MKVNEIEQNSKVVNLIVSIESLEEAKESNSGIAFQEGIVSDETGQVKISLWADQVGKFRVGDKISINAGWAKTFKDELQVSSGKFGKIVIIPKGV